jgi:1-deoxy-D-xylulose-5-phosphate reductoisomerase
MKKIAILGSTGSIGVTSCDVIRVNKDHFKVVLLTANTNYELLAKQANEFRPACLYISSKELLQKLTTQLQYAPKIFCGDTGLLDAVCECGANILLNALVGSLGLLPTLKAIELSMDVALANKESLVLGGDIVTSSAKSKGIKILPVDSEHNAIFQCLQGNLQRPLKKIILTASGGPFLRTPLKELASVTPEQALKHPTWGMGKKISIDSATMVNKGLEIIEAKWLFDIPATMIDVLIHPQSIVHGMVEFNDGSLLSMLGPTSMSVPIAHALFYPNSEYKSLGQTLDMSKGLNLEFISPDEERFPLLAIAKHVAQELGTKPAVFNAVNEVAVKSFIDGKIRFIDIHSVVEKVLSLHTNSKKYDLKTLLEVDGWARNKAEEFIRGIK